MNINNTDKFCFFYKNELPDFGDDFIYIKLGKKEKLDNNKNYKIIFETDCRDNISSSNPWLWDYTGLYLLYKNNLVTKKNILVLHYDAVLEKNWEEKLSRFDGRLGVFGELTLKEWVCFNKPVNVLPFIEIDEIFNKIFGKSFWKIVRDSKIELVAGFSQFLATKNVFNKMMGFLIPVIDYIKNKKPSIAYYAHLMEICWALFCALEGYQLLPFCKHEVSSSHLYGRDLCFDPLYVSKRFESIVNEDIDVATVYEASGLILDELSPFKLESKVEPSKNLHLL